MALVIFDKVCVEKDCTELSNYFTKDILLRIEDSDNTFDYHGKEDVMKYFEENVKNWDDIIIDDVHVTEEGEDDIIDLKFYRVNEQKKFIECYHTVLNGKTNDEGKINKLLIFELDPNLDDFVSLK